MARKEGSSRGIMYNERKIIGLPKSDLIDGLFGLLVFFFSSATEGERVSKSVTKPVIIPRGTLQDTYLTHMLSQRC